MCICKLVSTIAMENMRSFSIQIHEFSNFVWLKSHCYETNCNSFSTKGEDGHDHLVPWELFATCLTCGHLIDQHFHVDFSVNNGSNFKYRIFASQDKCNRCACSWVGTKLHNPPKKGWEHTYVVLHNHLAHCIPTHTISNALQTLVVWIQHQSQHVLCFARVKTCCKSRKRPQKLNALLGHARIKNL